MGKMTSGLSDRFIDFIEDFPCFLEILNNDELVCLLSTVKREVAERKDVIDGDDRKLEANKRLRGTIRDK